MDLPDDELVRRLEARDGLLRDRSFSHNVTGTCRYAAIYPDGACPWCAAVERRRQRQEQA